VWRLTFEKVAMPEIQVPPPPAFGAACPGIAATAPLQVCNTSAGDLIVSAITSSNPAFVVGAPSGGFPVTISHDFCFPFPVTFTPSAPGPQSATLTITSNDPNFPSITVTSIGAGLPASDIRVTGSMDFGVVSAWAAPTRTSRVCNVGACPLVATAAAIDCTDFSLVHNPLPSPLQPGACLDVEVAFTRPRPGTSTCELTITSTSPITPSVTRTLAGETPPALAVHAGIAWPHGLFGSALDHGSTLNLAFIDFFKPQWAWELRFGVTRFDGNAAAGGHDTDAWHLAPNARFTFNPGAPWLVFVNGGLGLYHFNPGDVEAGLNLGGGVQRPLGHRFALEGTYDFHWAFTASPTRRYSQVQGGLVVSF
jgi:hypothetical protein